jgi:hypothetical protein
MAESGRFPKPYVSDVKVDESLMVYPPFPKMGIGARTSGLPDKASEGPKNLDHVGENAGGSKKK